MGVLVCERVRERESVIVCQSFSVCARVYVFQLVCMRVCARLSAYSCPHSCLNLTSLSVSHSCLIVISPAVHRLLPLPPLHIILLAREAKGCSAQFAVASPMRLYVL